MGEEQGTSRAWMDSGSESDLSQLLTPLILLLILASVIVTFPFVDRFASFQSASELRDAGAYVRAQHGWNTCIRCQKHYHPIILQRNGPTLPCTAHTQPRTSQGTYGCCGRETGAIGCTPTTHLPTFVARMDGTVDGESRVDYSKDDINVVSSESSASSVSSSSSPSFSVPLPLSQLGEPVPRLGDEIMVCGQLYHTGTPVVLWGDVGGYDHYRVERRFCPFDESSWEMTHAAMPKIFLTPNRFGLRKNGLTPEEVEKVRGGQWDLKTLSKQMTQLVLHYDEAGLSRECFRILQDERDLSIHLMCDLDGTIYQALDLKERAWQATTSNTCSVGIEIANIGAYPPSGPNPFNEWYAKEPSGQTRITIPAKYGDGGIRTPGFIGHPARDNPVKGNIQGQDLVQFDYTPEQYAALSKIIATFCTIFPQIPCSYPRDEQGQLITHKLPDDVLMSYRGILGHYHIQTNKIDPGPAMQWDRLMSRAREMMMKSQQCKALEQMQKMRLDASPAPPPYASSTSVSSSSSSSSPSSQRIADWNVMRRSERKLLQLAMDSASKCVSGSASSFYFIPMSWWQHLQAWLHCNDDSITRPTTIPTTDLLNDDERTPRTGLVHKHDYKCIEAGVWKELIDLYGSATASIPIIRHNTDIYSHQPSKKTVVNSVDDAWTVVNDGH